MKLPPYIIFILQEQLYPLDVKKSKYLFLFSKKLCSIFKNEKNIEIRQEI